MQVVQCSTGSAVQYSVVQWCAVHNVQRSVEDRSVCQEYLLLVAYVDHLSLNLLVMVRIPGSSHTTTSIVDQLRASCKLLCF